MARQSLGLRAAAVVYRIGASIFHGGHDRGWFRRETLPVPVISVGNLAVGGRGKTPVVRCLAEAARRAGRRPAVLTRGYGGSGRAGVLRAGSWPEGPARARECGDEPLLLSRTLPEVPVVVGAKRARGARALLAAGEEVDLFLLDDGLQHRRLHRDVDLVLLDAEHPVGNNRLVPAGPLRESSAALRRADHLLLTGDGEEPAAGALEELDRMAPGLARTFCRRRPGGVRFLSPGEAGLRGEGPVPESLRGMRVHAVTGIARPRRFLATLREAGADPVGTSAYRDHHQFSAADVREEEARARNMGAAPVTTAKDAMRLEELVDPEAGWLVLDLTLTVEGGWDALLETLLPRAPR